jgi:hypothetical protein
LPLAVGCAPLSTRTEPPGGGSESSSGRHVGDGAETKNLAASDHGSIAKASLSDAASPPQTSSSAPAAVLVNQPGYLLGMVKLATVRTGENTPQPWHLMDSAGKEVLKLEKPRQD